MKWWMWIIIGVISLVIIGVFITYISKQAKLKRIAEEEERRKTLGEEITLQDKKNIEQKLENAPESRAAIQREIDKIKKQKEPWIAVATNNLYTKPLFLGKPICYKNMFPPITIGFSCHLAGSPGTALTKLEAERIINYIMS